VTENGRNYVSSQEGVTSDFRASLQAELLAQIDTGEYTLSSAAVSGGNTFLQTDGYLYWIGKKP